MSRKRLLLHGSNALIFTLLVLGILVVINYLAWKNGSKIDLTHEKLYSVSDQTVKVINYIDNEINVLAFFKEVGLDRQEFQDLINEYSRRNKNIKVKFVDPDREPGLTRKHGITDYGTVVLISGKEEIKVKLADLLSGGIVNNAEEELTNTLIKISSDSKKRVYFITGHGERDIQNNAEPIGLGRMKRALEDQGYEVNELLLLRESKIPDSNSILIIASPSKQIEVTEIQLIKDYLNNGGKALFLLEPRTGNELVSMLKDYGLEIENNIIIDPSSKLVGGGDVAPIIAQYPNHEITENFKLATIFPFARSINVIEKDGIQSNLIAHTSEYSWGEGNFSLFEEGVAEKDDSDLAGPLGVAAVGEIEGRGKIAVFGSVDVISNRFFDFSGNSDLFLNTITWIAGDENLISIRPRVSREGKLNITANQLRVVFLLTVVLLPALVLFSGIGVWWKRRNM